jgi:hypothetical protein
MDRSGRGKIHITHSGTLVGLHGIPQWDSCSEDVRFESRREYQLILFNSSWFPQSLQLNTAELSYTASFFCYSTFIAIQLLYAAMCELATARSKCP